MKCPGPIPRGMLCYYCENQARGTCRFCGAALCPAHVTAKRFLSGWQDFGPYGTIMHDVAYDYVVVENALWCGRCRVQAYRTRED